MFKYFDKNKIHLWGEPARTAYQSKDDSTCYVLLAGCHTFFTAVSICHNLSGSLATFDDKYSLENARFDQMQRPGGPEIKKCDDVDEDKYEACQWIGAVKNVWTWSSLGTSL